MNLLMEIIRKQAKGQPLNNDEQEVFDLIVSESKDLRRAIVSDCGFDGRSLERAFSGTVSECKIFIAMDPSSRNYRSIQVEKVETVTRRKWERL